MSGLSKMWSFSPVPPTVTCATVSPHAAANWTWAWVCSACAMACSWPGAGGCFCVWSTRATCSMGAEPPGVNVAPLRLRQGPALGVHARVAAGARLADERQLADRADAAALVVVVGVDPVLLAGAA